MGKMLRRGWRFGCDVVEGDFWEGVSGFGKFVIPNGDVGRSGMTELQADCFMDTEGLYLWPRKLVVFRRVNEMSLRG